MHEQVLVVDDNEEIANLIVTLLATEDMGADACHDGDAALALFGERDYDLVILDIMMPDVDGWEVCRRIREMSEVPILFLSARSGEVDKVRGFSLGADDYVTKPFKPFEFVARVKARMRRTAQNRSGSADDGVLRVCDIELDSRSHRASLHGVGLSLIPKEFDILELLLRNAGKPVSNRKIYERTWGEAYLPSATNTVMVHIRNLRHKLAAIDSSQQPIQTVWGVGYRVGDGRNEAGA